MQKFNLQKANFMPIRNKICLKLLKSIMKKVALISLFMATKMAISQPQDSLEVIDYSKFGDAEKVQRYCTPKILNQTPQKVWSIGVEYQAGFNMPILYNTFPGAITSQNKVNSVLGLKGMVNIPVISKDYAVWQLGGNLYTQQFNIESTSDAFANKLNKKAFITSGVNTTLFKPLNEKKFLILQAQFDVNGLFENFSSINNNAFTTSASAIYGWKKNDNSMFGVGLARTYRAGRVLHIPVILWNKNFKNDKWGMELLAPARAHLRYRPDAKNIFQLGYELEGNQFFTIINNQQLFIQRGELKPRLLWDTKVSNFYWLSMQLGYRLNWRFEAVDKYNGNKTNLLFSSQLANPFYLAINISFATP